MYRLRPTGTVDIDRNVFCLAGANGLGKSTFIAAINYALTGGVTPTKPKIDQLPRYYRDAAAYGDAYFSGRIRELDRDVASVSLTFSIGESTYHIRRRFFRPFELDEFSITSASSQTSVIDDPTQGAEERQKAYEDRIVQDTGLQTYAQFVFLQHFVFSFDENRHLLFWNARATELVLYLAFGLDPSMARRVDELRKAESVEGSGARNAQYQATLARNELKQVLAQLSPEHSIDAAALAMYGELQSERDRLTAARDAVRTELADARLELAEASANLMRTRDAYERAFAGHMRGNRATSGHPHALIAKLLAEKVCAVCGAEHAAIPSRVQAAIEAGICPMCDAEVTSKASPRSEISRDELANLDRQLADLSRRSKAAAATAKRLDTELRGSQQALASAIAKMSGLDESHGFTLTTAASHPDTEGLQAHALQLQGAVEVALGRKEEHLQRRKEIIAEYQPIQSALKNAWADAEMEFVPRFRAIAEDFIGLPLEVSLVIGEGISGTAHLVLSVDSSHRRRSEQLSESQRFFLDIALRMSLAQHMTGGGSCLLIDTPEGALDIAYEARAGDMFATFASGSDQIVMTANVNTSQLLLRLAERCGHEGMQLARMTDWTSLSDVQVREEKLFERAFDAVDAALTTGSLTHG
nr:AAA family ATPase [Frigoribacterium sp. CFBP 8751]